jgi:hypothetical protein
MRAIVLALAVALATPAGAHELAPDVLHRFVAVIRDAGCSMSVLEIDRDMGRRGFSPDEVWHAVSQLLNEGRARLKGGLTLILTEEECT